MIGQKPWSIQRQFLGPKAAEFFRSHDGSGAAQSTVRCCHQLYAMHAGTAGGSSRPQFKVDHPISVLRSLPGRRSHTYQGGLRHQWCSFPDSLCTARGAGGASSSSSTYLSAFRNHKMTLARNALVPPLSSRVINPNWTSSLAALLLVLPGIPVA